MSDDVISFERPPAEPAKIISAWATWTSGDELPGRTMADLKIAGLDVVLADLASDNDSAESLFEHWTAWEKGRSTPQHALAELSEHGLGDLIDALAAA